MGNALRDTVVRIADDALLGTLGLEKGGMQPVPLETLGAVMAAVDGQTVQQRTGGSAANAVRGIARLGMGAGFIGKVGRDAAGVAVRRSLEGVGITPFLRESPARTGEVVALVSPDASRTFATFLGAAATINSRDLSEADFVGYDHFHVEGYMVQNHTLFERALGTARQAMHSVSLDLSSASIIDGHREFLHRVMAGGVDVLFVNALEARVFTGLALEEALGVLGRMCRVVVVKLGREGALAWQDEVQVRADGHDVPVIDTTGAGDLFAAGFLYGYLRGWDLGCALALAVRMAEEVIGVLGTHISVDRWAALRAVAAEMEG